MPKRALESPATMPSRQQDCMVRNSILAGSVAGMASTLVMYPFDVIRTKMQTSGMFANARTAAAGSSAIIHRGPLQVLQHTIHHGGARALYIGMTPVLAAQAVYKSTVFSVNNLTQSFVLDFHRLEHHKQGYLHYEAKLSLLDHYICGGVGGAVNAFLFVTPVEFVRNQMIAQHSRDAAASAMATKLLKRSSAWNVISQSVSKHGWTSLWRGASWSVARDGWGCGWFFLTMAGTQQLLTPAGESSTFPVTVLAGGVSGLAFWLSSLPLDTVKTWVQSAELTSSVSATETLSRTLRFEGPGGVIQQLFRGWQVAFGRGIPSAAITISVYSYVSRCLDPGGRAV